MMAKKEKKANKEREPEEEFENTPSVLDEQTHTEMLHLYNEAATSIRFAKNMQWGTVASSLLVFAGVIIISKFIQADNKFVNLMAGFSILYTVAAILSLSFYQFWQHNEKNKIHNIVPHLSTLFKRIRMTKSSKESNIHRYIFLVFMIGIIIIGAIFMNIALPYTVYTGY